MVFRQISEIKYMDILYYQFPESFKYVKILQEKTGLLEEKNIITDKLKKTLENEEHIFDLYNESHAIFLTENIANEKIFFKDFLRKKLLLVEMKQISDNFEKSCKKDAYPI